MTHGSGKHAKKTTFSKNGPAQIRKSQNVLPQMENSWDGSATNEEFPKWATTNQELLKCDSGFVVAHFKNSSFVAPLFGNSHFVAGSLKEFSICEKAWSKQSFLGEIRAQPFFTLTYGVADAYSTNDNPSREKLSDWIEWSGEVISLGLFDYRSY